MNNKQNKELQIKLGNATEKNICKTLRNAGYWVYNIPRTPSGQPCDIMALKGGNNYFLIDGKHVNDDKVSFTFDRIEPNQITAFEYAYNYAKLDNSRIGFAIFFDRDKQLRWLPYIELVKLLSLKQKSVNMNDLKLFEEVLKDENGD